MDPDFLRALAGHCRQLNPEFWFVGEVVMGDYRRWANAEMLDSVTNYECYKGLYSSHVDHNYFEIAYSLNRLFGDEGIYRHLLLYSFADNHDVNRVASSLTAAEDLYPLYILLFTMPGIPSIYYGSEWGIRGTRSAHSDKMLRPSIHLNAAADTFPHPALAETIQRLALLRQHLPALRQGTYRPLHTAHKQFAFARTTAEQTAVTAVNASAEAVTVRIPKIAGKQLVDRLNGQCVEIRNGSADLTLYPHWGAVLTVE
ncbi:MAG: alpha-glucosidase C-terminal domain-containing protein [Anaerolineae bacterium]